MCMFEYRVQAGRTWMGWIIGGIFLAGWAAQPTQGSDDWLRHCQTLQQHAGICRLYLFETAKASATHIASRAGETESLSGADGGSLLLVPGQCPSSRAVHVEEGHLDAAPVAVGDDGFTVEMWVRNWGRGNSSVTGVPTACWWPREMAIGTAGAFGRVIQTGNSILKSGVLVPIMQ